MQIRKPLRLLIRVVFVQAAVCLPQYLVVILRLRTILVRPFQAV